MTDSAYQVCTRCVMDTSDPEITFDADGVCNHCHEFDVLAATEWFPGEEGKPRLETLLAEIKAWGKGRDYDCTIGLSGGADSSYLAYMAVKEWGLRPLAVHVDTGWNSPYAVRNIENLVKKLDIDLYTFVIDWEEMRDLQVAFLKSGVANQDTPQDHAIFAELFGFTTENNIRYVLSGHNIATESVLPKAWEYTARDDRHIRAIHKKFGTIPLKTLPIMSAFRSFLYARLAPFRFLPGLKIVNPLDLTNYTKAGAKALLAKEIGWQEYGAKHFESRFTKFFQAYWLPHRFGYDKRRAHLSSLILSGQISRDEALTELAKPMYPAEELAEDLEFVRKKLRLTDNEFKSILEAPTRHHTEYPSYATLARAWRRLRGLLKRRPAPKPVAANTSGAMNVCIVGSADDNHVVTRANALAGLGHKVSIVSPVVGDGVTLPLFVPTVRQGPADTVSKLRMVVSLARILMRQRPDIYYAHYAAEYGCWLAALLFRRPLAINAMGSDVLIEAAGKRGLVRSWLTRFALRSASILTVKSPFLASTLEGMGIDRSKIHEVIWGIDPVVFKRSPEARQTLRKQWGIGDETTVLLSPRPLKELYRHHLAIEALPHLIEWLPGVILALTEFKQDAAYRRSLDKLITKLDVAKHVMFLPPQSSCEMPGVLSSADVIVSLSSSDGTPQTVLEALACETPTLLVDIPDIRAVFDHEENCIICPDSPAAIAEGIYRISIDFPLREKLVRGGSRLIEEKANLPRELERVERLLKQAITHR